MSRKLKTFFLAPSDGSALAILRIVIGAAILAESLQVLPYLEQLYGHYGFISSDLAEALTGAGVQGLLAKIGLPDEAFGLTFKVFYLVHMAAAAAFTFGYRSRLATIAVWLTQTVILNSGYLSSYGVDRYFQNIVFLMIWFPVGRLWSLDRYFSKQSYQPEAACTLGLRLIQIFFLMTYIDAGFSKAAGSDWWTGEVIWRVLNQPEFSQFDFLWLANYPWLAKLISVGTIFLEGLYFIGIWLPLIGPLWLFAIVTLHLGIAATMGLTLFGLTMAGINLALFSPARFTKILLLRP